MTARSAPSPWSSTGATRSWRTFSSFAKAQGLAAAGFTGLGALSDAVLGYFDWQKKDYRRIAIDEQVEVLNLTGNIALKDGEPNCIRTSCSARPTAARTGVTCWKPTCGRRWK